MLTSYRVTCPHLGCNWHGNLIPHVNAEPWHGQAAGRNPVVLFDCPRCHGEWSARVVGDDVHALPVEAALPGHELSKVPPPSGERRGVSPPCARCEFTHPAGLSIAPTVRFARPSHTWTVLSPWLPIGKLVTEQGYSVAEAEPYRPSTTRAPVGAAR